MPARDIIAYLADGDVLLESGRLPSLAEPERQRDVLDRVGADVFAAPPQRVATDVVVQTVTGRTPSRPQGNWVPVDTLTDAQACPGGLGPGVRSAVSTAARQRFGGAPVPTRRPEWYLPGWLDAVDDWIDAALASAGRRRSGDSVVMRMWSLSAIVRVPTDAGAVFFKAAGGGFEAEPTVTAFLAGRYPELVPTVLATSGAGGRQRRAWMLMEELTGVDPDRAPGAAVALAPVLAELQAATAGVVPDLLAAGCPDRTMTAMLDGLDMLLRDSVELDRLSAAELAAARSAAPRMADLVRALWGCGLPATLTHGDLHVGNVAFDGDRVRVFDWTDAAVSHPCLDAVMLARSSDEDAPPGTPAAETAVGAAFATRWQALAPEADVDRAMALAVPANELYQAISYEGIYRNQEDASRWELEGVVERFLRRLPELVADAG